MLIGVDGNEANIEQRVGVGQYAFDILWSIYKLAPEWKEKHRLIVYLKSPPRTDLPKETDYFTYKVITGSGVWIVTKLMPELNFGKNRPDVFFTPSHYVPFLTPMPKVMTIHDLGYLKFSEQFKKYDYWQLKLWTAISLKVSKSVIAVSRSERKNIVRHYSRASKKVTVVHHGYDKNRFNTNISQNDVRRIKKKYSIVNDYLLFLSTLKPSKNVEGVIEAWFRIQDEFSQTKLVIAGKKGWLFEPIFEKVKELKLEGRIVFTDYVSEKDKSALLAGAKLFVSPSFWEGFGIIILESMATGTPVITSNIASMPEVAGKAGVFVDPKSPEDIAEKIKKILKSSEDEYNELVEAGLTQVKKFSWEKSGKGTLEVILKATDK